LSSTFKRSFHRSLVLLAMLLCTFTLLATGTSSVHAQTTGSPKQTLTVVYHGKTYSAPIGNDIVIPVTNQNGTGTIHLSATVRQVRNQAAPIPNSSGCLDAIGNADYVTGGVTVMHYSLDQFFCDDGNATITSLPSPQGAGRGGIPGVALTSHNEGNNWVSKPFSAQSVGNYVFTLGVPTPWGPVGGNCTGWVRLNTFGDGGWTIQQGTC
jgi:hypothetical protein